MLHPGRILMKWELLNFKDICVWGPVYLSVCLSYMQEYQWNSMYVRNDVWFCLLFPIPSHCSAIKFDISVLFRQRSSVHAAPQPSGPLWWSKHNNPLVPESCSSHCSVVLEICFWPYLIFPFLELSFFVVVAVYRYYYINVDIMNALILTIRKAI